MAADVVPIFETSDFEAQIARGAGALKAGNLIVLPTETVYGVAGMLSHPESRQQLARLRGREASTPMTVHLAHREDALKYISLPNEFGRRMMRKLWPGPVGLVFDVPADQRKKSAERFGVAENELYHDGTIVLRCPDHIVAAEIIAQVDAPVVLAQTPGTTPASRADALDPAILDNVSIVFDAGPSRYARPSTIVKVQPNSYTIVRQGVYDNRIIERLMRTTILFICSGNTCRSPMAEALARKILAEKLKVAPTDLDKKGISVISAGSFALPGAQATPQAVEAIAAMGGDLSRHRSRPLSVELIHQADVIFAMGRGHTQAVASLVPSAMEKTSTLDPNGDIEDPIGSNVEVYRKLAGELETLIEKRLSELPELG